MRSSTFVTTYSTALLTRPPLLGTEGGAALGVVAGGGAAADEGGAGTVDIGMVGCGITANCVPLKGARQPEEYTQETRQLPPVYHPSCNQNHLVSRVAVLDSCTPFLLFLFCSDVTLIHLSEMLGI